MQENSIQIGDEILEIGNEIEAPEPNDTDSYTHSFVGTIVGFKEGYVQVSDCDDNVFDIERERFGESNSKVEFSVTLRESILLATEALSQLVRGESSETILSNLDASDEYLNAVLETLWRETA